MWTCLEIVLWNLSEYQQSSSRESQQLDPLANTIHKSTMAVRSRKNPQGSANPLESVEVPRCSWNTIRSSLVAFLSMKSWQMMTSKEWQGEPIPQVIVLVFVVVHSRFGLYLYPFQTFHILSSFCSSKMSHALFPGYFPKNTTCIFLAKYPLLRQFPEKHHMAQLSLQRNQKFPLQLTYDECIWYVLQGIYPCSSSPSFSFIIRDPERSHSDFLQVWESSSAWKVYTSNPASGGRCRGIAQGSMKAWSTQKFCLKILKKETKENKRVKEGEREYF